uniref:GNAT family N-acetyltransferase n=1 Tax=Noviherbaspirillum sp. TaxID=1926288 RepID=UPI002FDF42A7
QHTTRTECKKASHRFGMQVTDELPLDVFLALNRKTFARQGLAVPYSDAFVRRFDAACAERGCRAVLIAADRHGRPAAGLYMVWDENSAYGLMAGADPEMRHSGAASLCFWEAIQRSSRLTRRFDFSGSMMQPVERFFRGFGASLMPYSCISKSPSRLMRLRQGMLFALKDQ